MRDVHTERECAVADLPRDVQRVVVHRKVLADGGVVTAVLGELAEHARMRLGLFSKTACGCNRMHVSEGFVSPLMLTPIYYGATPRVASTRRGFGGVTPPPGVY